MQLLEHLAASSMVYGCTRVGKRRRVIELFEEQAKAGRADQFLPSMHL